LFGGGPMSGGTPTQLPGPRIPTFNLGTNPPPQPQTPASVVGGLVDEYGNPASFSPAELEAMLAATPTLYSFQQGPNLSRPAPVQVSPLESGTTVSPTGQILHYGPNRGGLQVARSQFG